MKDIRKTIDALRDETSEDELLGILAMDDAKRLEYRERAADKMKLLAEAEQAIRQSGTHHEEAPKS